MKLNNIRQRWHDGQPVLNGWLSIASSFSAEIMAAQGYDSLTIDLQHGFVGYEEAKVMLQAMRASDVAPVVRVPWLEPGIIMKALDAGAWELSARWSIPPNRRRPWSPACVIPLWAHVALVRRG